MIETAPVKPGGPNTTPADHAILALDLGTTTGWAHRATAGQIVSGTVSFRPSRYDSGGTISVSEVGSIRLQLMRMESARSISRKSAAIWERTPRTLYGGFLAILTAWCETRGIAYQGVPVGTIKRHITAKGNADKAAMISAIRVRGFNPADDNEADAIAILLWAVETAGGAR